MSELRASMASTLIGPNVGWTWPGIRAEVDGTLASIRQAVTLTPRQNGKGILFARQQEISQTVGAPACHPAFKSVAVVETFPQTPLDLPDQLGGRAFDSGSSGPSRQRVHVDSVRQTRDPMGEWLARTLME